MIHNNVVLYFIKYTSGDSGNSEEILASYESISIDSFQLCETTFFKHLSLSIIGHGSTPCKVWICLLKEDLRKKSFLHKIQINGLSVKWVASCSLKSSTEIKHWGQDSQYHFLVFWKSQCSIKWKKNPWN